jgi:hypothetical protein
MAGRRDLSDAELEELAAKYADYELTIKILVLIEVELDARRILAIEWLEDTTTDERKTELEKQIMLHNKAIADLLLIPYDAE